MFEKVSKEKSLENRIVAVDKFAPLITFAFNVDTLIAFAVTLLKFGLVGNGSPADEIVHCIACNRNVVSRD